MANPHLQRVQVLELYTTNLNVEAQKARLIH